MFYQNYYNVFVILNYAQWVVRLLLLLIPSLQGHVLGYCMHTHTRTHTHAHTRTNTLHAHNCADCNIEALPVKNRTKGFCLQWSSKQPFGNCTTWPFIHHRDNLRNCSQISFMKIHVGVSRIQQQSVAYFPLCVCMCFNQALCIQISVGQMGGSLTHFDGFHAD